MEEEKTGEEILLLKVDIPIIICFTTQLGPPPSSQSKCYRIHTPDYLYSTSGENCVS